MKFGMVKYNFVLLWSSMLANKMEFFADLVGPLLELNMTFSGALLHRCKLFEIHSTLFH